jgi:hypothetical protein
MSGRIVSYPTGVHPVIDAVGINGVTEVGFAWAPWLANKQTPTISSATWTTDDGVTLGQEQLLPDDSGAATIAVAYVTVTDAPLNSWIALTCQVTAGLSTESRTMRAQVLAL